MYSLLHWHELLRPLLGPPEYWLLERAQNFVSPEGDLKNRRDIGTQLNKMAISRMVLGSNPDNDKGLFHHEISVNYSTALSLVKIN